MTIEAIGDIFYRMFYLAIQIGGPILIVAMAIGMIISILQAATQIHEQTLTFVPKLVVIGIMLMLTGGTMLVALQEFLVEIFDMIAGR